MTKKTLFQNNSSGGIKVWTIEVINNGKSSILRSTAGQQGGKMAVHDQEVKGGKSSGKANATTHYTQACAQAESKYKQKIRKGYVADVTKIQSSSVMGTAKIPQPMLAEKYDPTKKQPKSRNLKEIGILGKEVVVQRKKDGNRCLYHVNQTGIKQYTRKGDEKECLTHISDSLHKSFLKIFKYVNEKYGVTEYWLDGELYTNEYSFSKLNGLVNAESRTPEEVKLCEKMKYHLYDVMIDADYTTRMKIIDYFKSATVHVEESYKIIATDAELMKWQDKFLAEGEEGLMIRVLGMPYQHKRTWGLCKMKLFEDKEFLIIGIEEDKRGGMAGKVVVAIDKKGLVDSSGNPITQFKPGLTGSHDEWKEMWKNQSKYIGKWATIEFFGRSEYGVPRFPKYKGLRNDAPKKAKKAKK